MKKKCLVLSLFFFCNLFCLIAYASDIGYSNVTITNNTAEKITISPTLITTDKDFKKGRDWDGGTITLAAYESKKVLWFSRYTHVKQNQTYRFDLIASHPSFPGYNIKFTFNEQGKLALGSKVAVDMMLPQGTLIKLFNKQDFEKFSDVFWNDQFTIFARSWLPTGNIYNSYQFVIDKIEQNAFETPSKNQISILSYNVQLLPFYAGVVDHLNQPGIRVQEIPKKVTNFDVVILEELFDHDLRERMKKALEPLYPYYTDVVKQTSALKAWTGGVMIFSKWPIVTEKQVIYRESAGIDGLAAKGAMYAAINKQGKIYHVFGTHLQAGGNEKEKNARAKQLLELANFVASLNIPIEEPILLGGDMNINEFSNEVDILLTSLNVDLVKNIGYPYSSDGNINCMKIDDKRSRIDYVLYNNLHSKPTKAINKVFIVRAIENEKMWPKFDISDHFPVASFFEFT